MLIDKSLAADDMGKPAGRGNSSEIGSEPGPVTAKGVSQPSTHNPFFTRVDTQILSLARNVPSTRPEGGSELISPPRVSSLINSPDDLKGCSFGFTADGLVRRMVVYTPDEVVNIRDAAKLSAKFFSAKQDLFIESRPLSLCTHAFDVGLILCLSRERKELVIAGILSNSLQEQLKKDVGDVKETIRRKFGSEVLSLIEAVTESERVESRGWFARQLDHFVNPRASSRDVATLDCAIKISIASTANRLIEEGVSFQNWPERIPGAALFSKDAATAAEALENNLAEFTRHKVPVAMLIQLEDQLLRLKKNLYGEDQDLKVCVIPSTDLDTRYGVLAAMAQDAKLIRIAAEYSSALFQNTPRNWGPSETLPLSAHQFEVGMLLSLSGCSKDLIIAGFFHDLYEGYIEIDRDALRPRIVATFGERVCELIESVTEPPKSNAPSNWWERKNAVLENMAAGDQDMATLCCATKISTLAAGNKFLYSGADIREWSSGSLEDNGRLFRRYLEVFESKGVPESLIEQFKFELARFESHIRAG